MLDPDRLTTLEINNMWTVENKHYLIWRLRKR